MKKIISPAIIVALLVVVFWPGPGSADPVMQQGRAVSQSPCTDRSDRPTPACGVELTCTDKAVQLGYSDGVCFRATCAGVWALTHKRVDQASFRRRLFTYRHYHFVGYWDLKDQGAVESVHTPLRELFLVLPDDLIELRLSDPDCYAKVEVRDLGYIKKGDVHELKQWLAYHTFMEMPNRNRAGAPPQVSSRQDSEWFGPWLEWCDPRGVLSRLLPFGINLGGAR